MFNFENKKVLLLGIGKTGKAILNIIHNQTGEIDVYDDSDIEFEDNSLFKKLLLLKVNLILNKDFLLEKVYDYIIVSPGVDINKNQAIKQALKNGAKILGEIEVAYLLGKGNFVGITGTNGKTTTTSLTYKIVHDFNKNSYIGGNIGDPISEIAYKSNDDAILVTEISSFQLETVKKFRPFISVLLNITEDHLDRHVTMENYIEEKKKIFKKQGKGDFLIYNADDEILNEIVNEKDNGVIKIPFSTKKTLDFGLYLKNEKVVFKSMKLLHSHPYLDNDNTIEIFKITDLKIKGEHNIKNALAAALVGIILKIPCRNINESIANFAGVEHRCEEFLTINGINFVNDSKGTNPDSTKKAVFAFEENIRLILGGYNKKSDFTSLAKMLKGKVKKVYLMGENKEDIKKTLVKVGFKDYEEFNNLRDATVSAFYDSSTGDNIVLSPASASWDKYKNFEERGEEFKTIAYNLREK